MRVTAPALAFVVVGIASHAAAQEVGVIPLPAGREPFVVAVPTPSPEGLGPAALAGLGVLLGSTATHLFESRRQRKQLVAAKDALGQQLSDERSRLDIQLAAERARLDVQLAHERELRARDEIATLRRDAALRLAAALPGAREALMAMISGSASDRKPERLAIITDASAHYTLVGSPEALAALQAFNDCHRGLMLWMMEASEDAAEARFLVERANASWERQHAEFERVGREMTLERETGRPDAARLETLARQRAYLNAELLKLAEEKKAAFVSYTEVVRQTRVELMARLPELTSLQRPLTEALRADLGVGGDLASVWERAAELAAALHAKIEASEARQSSRRLATLERLVPSNGIQPN